MKSIHTPWTHTGTTKKEMTVKFGATGCSQYEVAVPAGTLCRKLDGGSDPWVVGNLSFIGDKTSIMYSDADIYGIRIPEADIENITPV